MMRRWFGVNVELHFEVIGYTVCKVSLIQPNGNALGIYVHTSLSGREQIEIEIEMSFRPQLSSCC